MPRKPKVEKQQIKIVVDGVPITVIMHPPTGAQKSWYAFWHGLARSKSTSQRRFEDAVAVAENMLRNGGDRAQAGELVLSDEEFEEIQRAHYGKVQDPEAKVRAEKSLGICLDALAAFREITNRRTPVSTATPDECAAFQRKALRLRKSWRLKYPKARKEGVKCYSANTVRKWSRALEAAFERANINALKKKCVRGVVDNAKLLTSNPWHQFTWIEGVDRPVRQFDPDELLSVLEYFEQNWSGISVALLATKVSFWSWSRLSEFANLRWEKIRTIEDEVHLEIIGKWGVEKWARIPNGLYEELLAIRTDSPFIFAAYNQQLRDFYTTTNRSRFAHKVGAEFNPRAFADWFQERIPMWAETTGSEHATPHVFRKTSLQHASDGEEMSEQVAEDAALNLSVMQKHYLTKRQRQFRLRSNRSYRRILASLPLEVATRYGYVADNGVAQLEKLLKAATEAQDWSRVGELAAELARHRQA